ncbi:D-2-hydroxyacid dehydrogenase [Arthrobacter sp. MW3 TE3886]|uniref:D-2-hydroxyacid dehydrogenase n=1 Tax=Arthrobacter sp. MW3 TE3886 TaxID=3156254 RepID=UPI00351918D0
MSGKPVVTVLEGEFPVFGLDRIEPHADVRIVNAAGLREALPGSQVLFLWDFFSPAITPLLAAPHTLEWIHVAATGVDKLLVPELVASSVVLTNASGVFDRPIAEYVLACVSAHLKHLPQTRELQREKSWLTRETRNLAGTRVVVVGAGGIGRETGRLLRAVGMDVTIVGRSERTDPEFGRVHAASDLTTLVGDSDVIVGALPLTERTMGLISAETIRAMKKTAYFINVGRGQTVDQEALTAAILAGDIEGAALDTFVEEPLPRQDPLWEAPGVLVSPHTSSRTTGWLDQLVDQFCKNFDDWRAGRPLDGIIDKQKGYAA